MDFGSLAMAMGIALYGLIEYRRRERVHRTELAYVRRGETPPRTTPRYPVLTLVTTAGTAALLLVSAALLIVRGPGLPRYGASIAAIGVIFLILSVPVSFMLIRDLRTFRSRRRTERSAR